MEQNEVKRQSVLVVEDEPGIAAVCMRILSQRRISSGHCGKWRGSAWRCGAGKIMIFASVISGHPG